MAMKKNLRLDHWPSGVLYNVFKIYTRVRDQLTDAVACINARIAGFTISETALRGARFSFRYSLRVFF